MESPTPSRPRVFCTFGSSGSAEPSSNATGFLMSMTCLRPIDVSAASYIPGASLARGSLASEPVIPAGSGAAGSGANGFSSPSLLVGFVSAGFADCGDGDGDGVCAWILVTKHKHNKREATSKGKALVCTRFIVSPLEVFPPQHCLHNPDLSALATVDIGREIEQFSVLPRARSVEQVLHHNQRAAVVLDHPSQK